MMSLNNVMTVQSVRHTNQSHPISLNFFLLIENPYHYICRRSINIYKEKQFIMTTIDSGLDTATIVKQICNRHNYDIPSNRFLFRILLLCHDGITDDPLDMSWEDLVPMMYEYTFRQWLLDFIEAETVNLPMEKDKLRCLVALTRHHLREEDKLDLQRQHPSLYAVFLKIRFFIDKYCKE